jgi:hypothetical protein
MKNKFTRKEIKIIQNFVNEIDNNIKVKKSKVFECEIEKNQIFVSDKNYTKDTELFMKWLETLKEYQPINFILISILHEIGHIETYTEELEEERNKMYSMYSFLNKQGIMSTEELNNLYFEIPDEKNATLWGLNYYVNNKEKCNKLLQDLNIM